MYKHILVPLDGSPFGEHALPLALSLARRASATLHLVHVHQPAAAIYTETPVAFNDAWEMHLKDQEKAYLEDVARRLSAIAAVTVTTTLVEGEVEPMLRTAAEGSGADLVVMTTHGRGALGRFWLGSVTDDLVRDLSVPLLLVRPTEEAVNLQSDVVLKNMLVPLDGTPVAEQVLEPALAMGRLMDAQYTLLRVVPPAMTPVLLPEGGITPVAQPYVDQIEQAQADMTREAQAYLDRVAERLRGQSLRVKTLLEVEAQPAVAILEHAKPPAVDLIAVETHGRRGLTRLFVGSVADKVIRGASVPVLVHRPVFQ